MFQRTSLIGLFVMVLLLPGVGFAQDGVTQADEARLTSLYRSLLKAPDDQYVQRRITEERSLIRAAIEKEVRSTPRASDETPTPADGEELPSAIEKQRTLVSSLGERLKELKADQDML